MKIILRLRNEKLNKDPKVKQWLKSCEKMINKELKDKCFSYDDASALKK